MTPQLPIIIVVVPLILAVLNAVVGQRYLNSGFTFALAAMSVCLACSVLMLMDIRVNGALDYHLGGWPPPVGIVYAVDSMNAFMPVLISFIGFIAVFHAKRSVAAELPDRIPLFWCLFLLLTTGLLGIALTGDLFNLFVFLEVASLTGYALVAVGNKKATVAGIRYLILGSIGASFYLLGVGYLYIATGTLNMANLAELLPRLYHTKTVLLGFSFILIGLGVKSALFPMHIWLPDAYTYAPSAVSVMVAPLVTKVMAYAVIRVMFTVFDPEFSITILGVTDILVWLGILAMVYGAVMALSQTDFRRMLSYVIIAEIGYILGGAGVANTTALKGAVFHIINDAAMMACLFLTAGLIFYQKGGTKIENFKGVFNTMPITAAVFTTGALAVIGVPPMCGFFSKWYLLLGGIQAGQWGFVAALFFCTLVNIALFFRVFDRGLFSHARGTGNPAISPVPNGAAHSGDAPVIMLFPAVLAAVAVILLGVFNQVIINDVLDFNIF